MRQVVMTLSYRPGVEPAESHIGEFAQWWTEWTTGQGIDTGMHAVLHTSTSGMAWWEVEATIPAGITVPYLDKAGAWPHGMTMTRRVRYSPRQVGASAPGWSAGLSALVVTRPPESLTQARPSVPDTHASQPA